MRRGRRFAAFAATACGAMTLPLAAQDPGARVQRLLDPRTTSVGVVGHYWTFGDDLFEPAGSDLRITRAAQISVPLVFSIPLGTRFGFDVSGSYGYGGVEIESPDGQRAGYYIEGPSDLRLRATGRLFGDQVLLVAGVNVPTGSTSLSQEELNALRILAAPALAMSPTQAGSGSGGSAGVVVTRQIAAWALAFGASYELRGEYTPLEAITAGTPSLDYDPGEAVHLTLGANRPLGPAMMSLSVSADFYSEDQMASGGAPLSTVQLGPTFGALAQVDLGGSRFRQLVVYLSERFRSEYEADGASVAGSSANYLSLGFRSVYPLSRAFDFTAGGELRVHSGLDADQSLATASATVVGATLGLAYRAAGLSIAPFVAGHTGRIDPGSGSVSALGASAGILVTTRY